jgi:hypothetical protein
MFPVRSDRILIRVKLDPKIFVLRTGTLPPHASGFSFQVSGRTRNALNEAEDVVRSSRTIIGMEGISDRGCDNVLVFCAVSDFFHLLIG